RAVRAHTARAPRTRTRREPMSEATESDERLKREVERELEWDPQVDHTRIGVTVKNGAVALTGYVPKYGIKAAAVRAAERVRGVRAVADEIRVRLTGSVGRDDAAIAEAIARSLRWN